MKPIVRNLLIIGGCVVVLVVLSSLNFIMGWILDLIKASWSYMLTAVVSSIITAIICGIFETHSKKHDKDDDE